jgi:hypothetical protein
MENWIMPDTLDQQKRAVAGGIWSFCGDLVFRGHGIALLCFCAGLLVFGIYSASEWLFGAELGGKVGTWTTIAGGIMIAVMWHKAWWKQELRGRDAEYRLHREDQERIVRR